MPHRFTHAETDRLEGVWRTFNGRRFCAWRFERGSRVLSISRGVGVRSETIDSSATTLEELKRELPQLALEMAKDMRGCYLAEAG